jgi:aryl-alcohol dehydrogenase-like predicted oxidoreductase
MGTALCRLQTDYTDIYYTSRRRADAARGGRAFDDLVRQQDPLHRLL